MPLSPHEAIFLVRGTDFIDPQFGYNYFVSFFGKTLPVKYEILHVDRLDARNMNPERRQQMFLRAGRMWILYDIVEDENVDYRTLPQASQDLILKSVDSISSHMLPPRYPITPEEFASLLSTDEDDE